MLATPRSSLLTITLVTGFVACGPQVEPPKVQPTSTTTAPVVESVPVAAPNQYVLRLPARTTTNARFELDKGRIGLVMRGGRWIVDARGMQLESKDDGFSLSRATTVDAGAGGGFLFTGSTGLYLSATFDGPLKQIAIGSVYQASVGPGFVLAQMYDGRMRAYEIESGKPFTKLPLGTITFRTGKDGTVAAIAHNGRAYVSRDRGLTWSDVTADVGTPANVEVADGQLFVIDTMGEATRVDQGALVRAVVPAKPPPHFDPEWNRSETPLEFVVSKGVMVDEGRALAVDNGTIFEVALGSGKVVSKENGALPPQGSCVPISTAQRVLFLCGTSDGSSVFSRARRGSGATKLEKTFEGRGTFLRGANDTLLYTGSCRDMTTKPGIACVRLRSGEWLEVDRSADLSDAPASEPLRVITWVPKDEGAYLIVGGKNGGIWDAKSGAKSRLDDDQLKKIEPLLPSPSGRLVDRVGVAVGGDIVGVGRDNVGFRISEGGKHVERSPFRYNTVAVVSNRALAQDGSSNSLWQSEDWGWTYTEVEGPPDSANVRNESPRTCTEVGCVLSAWMRIGWELRQPTPNPPAQPTVSSGDSAKQKLPQLKCEVSGPMARKMVTLVDQRAGFGAEMLKTEGQYFAFYTRAIESPVNGTIEGMNLRAGVNGKITSFDTPFPPPSALAQTRRIRFVEPFDPKGTVHESTVKLGDLMDASRSVGATPIDPMTTDERGAAAVVLSDPPSVLLLNTGPLVWARAKEKPVLVALPDTMLFTFTSAVQTGPDELAVLANGTDGEGVVRTLGRGRANELFTIPRWPDSGANPQTADALAMGPDGKLAVLRFTTDAPPTLEDPALLMKPGEPVQVLAPWSTVELDGSPACENVTGYRAIVTPATPWMTAGVTAETWGRLQPTYLRVRWNATIVCVEAIEVAHGVQEVAMQQADSYIAARFGKDAGAGQVMIAEGGELREPRNCTLMK